MTSPRRHSFFFLRFGLLLLALCLLRCPASAAVPAVTAPSDVAALAALKAAVLPSSVPPRSCLATWDFSAADPCASPRTSYFVCGVVCELYPAGGGLARVTSVVLDGAGYEGELIPSAIANLSSLAHLDLSGNGFHGPVPAALGSLAALRTLSLASNAFSGVIPASLAGLGALELLDLSRNALTGAVPAALAAGLVSLRNLDLSYNRLSGGIPPGFPPNLVSLSLRGNALSGPLPSAAFAGLPRLEVVELAANRITGRLEAWFFRLPALQQANLANNSLVGISVGKPAASGSALVALDVGYNRIEGELPAELAGFPALTSLSLRHNRLKGAIPARYSAGKKAGNPFRRLFLDGNFLNGKVPAGWFLGGGTAPATTGSFGDNCLEGCPATEQLCQPLQKSADVCKGVYGDVARRRRRGPAPSRGGVTFSAVTGPLL